MSIRRRQNLRKERLKYLRHGSTIEELSLEVEDIEMQVINIILFLFCVFVFVCALYNGDWCVVVYGNFACLHVIKVSKQNPRRYLI